MDNINMKTIKFLKNDRIELDGIRYKGYTICDLPPSFGCIAMFYDNYGFPTTPGIGEWVKYKGLTYIKE
jgi:hypothetical protein